MLRIAGSTHNAGVGGSTPPLATSILKSPTRKSRAFFVLAQPRLRARFGVTQHRITCHAGISRFRSLSGSHGAAQRALRAELPATRQTPWLYSPGRETRQGRLV